MPQFYIKKIEENNEFITISDADILKHLFVMRVKSGEIVKFIDINKIKYETEVIEISKKIGKFKILKKYKSTNELKYNICVAQVLLKNSEAEAISNATQIGAKTIQPLLSKHCSVKKTAVNTGKLQKIAFESFKQCERADMPTIEEPEEIKKYLSNKKNVIICGEKFQNTTIKNCVKNLNKTSEIIVVIGAEGGFSDEEFEFFKENNYPIIGLGATILKAENAIIAGVSNIVYELER